MNEQINAHLQSALAGGDVSLPEPVQPESVNDEANEEVTQDEDRDSRIDTTEAEVGIRLQ